ncbi:MAG TPA: hypothetical protein VM686_28165 [Polyangiaceae bacterium]|nr:hypothetical protein [Polyangiaceae bacterium]
MQYRAQLPLSAVRDLIGIVRSMYFGWQERGVTQDKLDELVHVGRELREALELAARTEPDTVGHRAAWVRAERATAALCSMIAMDEPVRPTVVAAVNRARRPTR